MRVSVGALDVSDRANFSPSADVRIVDPLSEPSWDRLVLSHPRHTFFHRTAWAKVLSQTYGHKPVYLCFYRGDELVGLFPIMEVVSSFTGRRGVCLPFSDFCEPLLLDQWRHEGTLFKTLLEIGRERKWSYFQLRGGRASLPTSAVAAEKFYSHKLNLTIGIEQLFARFQGSVRRAIRKAEKSGLSIEVSSARKAMLDFYQLHVRTRRRHGLPPQSLPFFLNIDQEIMKAGLGFVVLVKHRTRAVAAAVFFRSGDAALFKFGASDERSHDFRGNNLVMWEGIKQLVGQGLKTLHFGRTSLDNDGLRRFKQSWGTEEHVIEYFRFALNTQTWLNFGRNAFEFHNQLFRSFPLAVNRITGALIYPHLD